MKLFGVEKIVLTNAAGGLNPEVSKFQSDRYFVMNLNDQDNGT